MLTLLPAARAQLAVDVSPYAGFFVPLRNFLVPTTPPPLPVVYHGTGPVALQKTIALGGRLTVWPTRPFGVEATFGYAPSGVTMGCRVSDCNAGHVVTGSAKVVVRPIGADSPRSFRVGGGIGIIGLGGTAYDGVATAASVAGTVGAGVTVKLGRSRSVRLEAEEYWFRPHLRAEWCDASNGVCRALIPTSGSDPQIPWKQLFQNVVILSIGLMFFRTG